MQFDQPFSVLVVIVNYCTSQLIINCLKSLEKQIGAFADARVVIVDNQSPDASVTLLQAAIANENWQNWVSVVSAPKNGGFAYGNNVAIRAALAATFKPNYIWLLNPDTEVRPGALTALYDFMQSHDDCGIAGSSFENQDGSDWPIAFRFPSLLSELDNGLRLGLVTRLLAKWVVAQEMPKQNAQVDWVSGASLMIRSTVFDRVGLMDENYFLYFEETDFCLQTKKAGWQIWYVPASRVMHIAGQSTNFMVKTDRLPRVPKYWFASRKYFFVKNYGRTYAFFTDLTWLIARLLWRVRQIIQRKPQIDPPYLLQDFIVNSLCRF